MSWYEDEKEWEMAKAEMNDVLRKKYPPERVDLIASNGKHIGYLLESFAPIPKRPLVSRLRGRLGTWLFSLAFWISGDGESEDEEWR